jgi:hypothetical protein
MVVVKVNVGNWNLAPHILGLLRALSIDTASLAPPL